MNRSKSCYEARETLDRRPGNSNPAGGGAFDSDPGLLNLKGLRALFRVSGSFGRPLFIVESFQIRRAVGMGAISSAGPPSTITANGVIMPVMTP